MNKNYNYLIDNSETIVSEEEHQKVLESVKAGKTLVVLRNGNLIINFSFVKKVIETDKMTVNEEKAREEHLKLPPADRPRSIYLPKNDILQVPGMAKIIGEGFKKCGRCGEDHYIPKGKIYCLPCLKITSKEFANNAKK